MGQNDVTTLIAWIGVFAYYFQVYFDFSGYSDMAIGLGKMFGFKINENFNPRRRPVIRMKNLSIDEKNEVIKKDNRYGKIICRCEKISEGEIVDCIKRNCGATTIKGVKKRVRAGFGKCQGGFCEGEVLKILVRELGMNPEEIEYAKTNSQILIHELGGKNNE